MRDRTGTQTTRYDDVSLPLVDGPTSLVPPATGMMGLIRSSFTSLCSLLVAPGYERARTGLLAQLSQGPDVEGAAVRWFGRAARSGEATPHVAAICEAVARELGERTEWRKGLIERIDRDLFDSIGLHLGELADRSYSAKLSPRHRAEVVRVAAHYLPLDREIVGLIRDTLCSLGALEDSVDRLEQGFVEHLARARSLQDATGQGALAELEQALGGGLHKALVDPLTAEACRSRSVADLCALVTESCTQAAEVRLRFDEYVRSCQDSYRREMDAARRCTVALKVIASIGENQGVSIQKAYDDVVVWASTYRGNIVRSSASLSVSSTSDLKDRLKEMSDLVKDYHGFTTTLHLWVMPLELIAATLKEVGAAEDKNAVGEGATLPGASNSKVQKVDDICRSAFMSISEWLKAPGSSADDDRYGSMLRALKALSVIQSEGQ